MIDHYRSNIASNKRYALENCLNPMDTSSLTDRQVEQLQIIFHHIDPSTKKFIISGRFGRSKINQSFIDEVKKCIIVTRDLHWALHRIHMMNQDEYESVISRIIGGDDNIVNEVILKYGQGINQYKQNEMIKRLEKKRHLIENCVKNKFDTSHITDDELKDLHFHHINADEKIFEIGPRIVRQMSRETEVEAKKCVAISAITHNTLHRAENDTVDRQFNILLAIILSGYQHPNHAHLYTIHDMPQDIEYDMSKYHTIETMRQKIV